ncbi:MAG: hypothetical protein M3P29_10895, partial [Acidobacteriota bacterium]|nr:hypothetical protein [Acidobacteriota bacterium]
NWQCAGEATHRTPSNACQSSILLISIGSLETAVFAVFWSFSEVGADVRMVDDHHEQGFNR